MYLQVSPASLQLASTLLAEVHTGLSTVLTTADQALQAATMLGATAQDDPSREFNTAGAAYHGTYMTPMRVGVTHLQQGQEVLVPTGTAYDNIDHVGEGTVGVAGKVFNR